MGNLKTILILIALASISTITLAQDKTGRVKIGVSTSLTGNAAPYGVLQRNALLFANEKLAGNKYDLIFEDDRCSPKDAVSIAHRFVDALKIKYVVGFVCSGTVLSTATIYNDGGAVPMTMGGSAPAISNLGVFRSWSSDEKAIQKLYEYVKGKHKVLGVLTEQTDYAQGFLRALQEKNKDGKLRIENEDFLTDTSDFKTLLAKLKSRNIDALFINSQTASTFLVALKQVKEMGLNVQLYSAYFAGDPSVLKESFSEGIIFASLPLLDDAFSSDARQIVQEFESRYGKIESIEMVFATAFEGFRALHQAIENGNNVREYLHKTKFHGLFGDWYFDDKGDIQGLEFVLKVVHGGKAELIPSR